MNFYFVKLYAYDHAVIFGDMLNDCVKLNELGQIALEEWQRQSHKYHDIEIDRWSVLPNRLEGIIGVREHPDSSGYSNQYHKPRRLSSFVAGYKAAAAKRINLHRNEPGSHVWLRSYQERFLPDEAALEKMRQVLGK